MKRVIILCLIVLASTAFAREKSGQQKTSDSIILYAGEHVAWTTDRNEHIRLVVRSAMAVTFGGPNCTRQHSSGAASIECDFTAGDVIEIRDERTEMKPFGSVRRPNRVLYTVVSTPR